MAYKRKKEVVENSLEIDLGTLKKWVNESEDATQESRTLAEKCRDYYDSKQWTDDEVKKLSEQKQAPTVSNRIKPKMDNLKGMEAANRTTVKAFPRTPRHEEAANAATEAIRYVLQSNTYSSTRSSMFDNYIIEGTGGCEVFVKKDDPTKINIKPIFWDRLIYDPHSRRANFSDARYLGQVVWMDYDEAVSNYPGSEDVLDSMFHGAETYDDKPRWFDSKRNRIKIVDLYYSYHGDIWYTCFSGGGYINEPQVSPYKTDTGETEWPYEFQSAFVDRDGGRYGAARQLLDTQDEINKRKSKALHLMSVRQTFGTEGAVPNLNEARSELAKPDGHLQVGYGEFGKDFGILPTGDMAQAQFKLLEIALQEIDSTGSNAALQGKGNNTASGRALLAREQAGKTELAPVFDGLNALDHRVYKKVWNRIKQYWREEKWIRVTDDERNLRWVGLNKPITQGDMALEAAQKNGMPPEQLAMLQQQIQSDPMMQVKISTANDVVRLDVDIILEEVPDVTTSQIEDFQTLGEMVKSGFPMPPKAVIEASPLHQKDKILKMMDEQPQLPPKIQEQITKMQEDNQNLQQENQQLKSNQQVEAAKVQQKAQVDQQNFALKRAETMEELKLKKAIAIAEREEARIKLETAREEAAIKLQIMREEAAVKNEIDAQSQAEKHRQGQIELDFQMKKDARESEEKIKQQASKEKAPLIENLLPQVMETQKKMVEAFSKAMESQTEVLEKLVQQIGKPKTVTLGGIRRDSEGKLTGASATTH